MPLTEDQRLDLLEFYIEEGKNGKAAVRRFANKYGQTLAKTTARLHDCTTPRLHDSRVARLHYGILFDCEAPAKLTS